MSGWTCKGDCSSWADNMKPCSAFCKQGKTPQPLYDTEFWAGVTAKIEAQRKATTPPPETVAERRERERLLWEQTLRCAGRTARPFY